MNHIVLLGDSIFDNAEPSAIGSAKIGMAIWRLIATNDFSRRQTVVFGEELR